VSGGGIVSVIGLDTGDSCRNQASRDGAWMVWNLPTIGDRLLVQANRGSLSVDRECAVAEVPLGLQEVSPLASSIDRLWMQSGSNHIVEHALPSGEETGRTVELPRFTGTTLAIVGDDLVVGANGEMTLLDPSTDERHALGSGTPLAAHGSLLAYATCPELHCRLGLLDIANGDRRFIDIEPAQWEPSTFSADGTLLRVPVPGRDEYAPSTAVVDLTTDSVWVIDQPLQMPQLTVDNRWLIGLLDGQVVGYRIGDVDPVVLTPDLRDLQGFGLL
jgi:hypothetical protein